MAKIKSLNEIKKLKAEAAEIVAEAKRKEKLLLQKIKEDEREAYAEIGKKAIELFNAKMSEKDFKTLLFKHGFLEKVEDKDDEKDDLSSENETKKVDDLSFGANNGL